jgi:hypothetical protein
MFDSDVVTPVTPVDPAAPAADKVKKVRVPKPPAEPKPLKFRKGLDGAAWLAKLASMTVAAIPEGYLGMADVCKKANEAGIKTSRLVTAAGGDRADKEPFDPVFQVVYVGHRKFMNPAVLDEGFMKLLDPEYHKTVRVGRVAKPKAEGAVDAAGKKIKKIKVAAEAKPWTEEAPAIPGAPTPA